MQAPYPWSDEIVERLCGEIASGRALQDVCTDDWCPSESTVYRRMAKDSAFLSLIDAARAAQQDHEVEECVRMADEATPEDWQVVKLRIWARQWRAGKLAPKKYGDRVGVDHSGSIDGPPTLNLILTTSSDAAATSAAGIGTAQAALDVTPSVVSGRVSSVDMSADDDGDDADEVGNSYSDE